MDNSIMGNSNPPAILDVSIENKAVPKQGNDNSTSSNNYSFENSIVQSPSLESFSTIADSNVLSTSEFDEDSDLFVKVDWPQKHLATLETFVTFRISTRVTREEFSENEYVVRRRYNDFIWLRRRLMDDHPFCIIPPLPGKHTLIGQLDRYSKDFILQRMKLLNIFMSRLVQHPILCSNESFKMFTTASQSDFAQYRKQTSIVVKVPVTHYYPTSSRPLKTNQEFDKTIECLSLLSEKLMAMEKVSTRIIKERQDFVADLNRLYPTFTAWSLTESPELASLLQNIASAFENSAFATSAAVISTCSNSFQNSVKELLTYVDVVQDVLHKRKLHQQNYEGSLEQLARKRIEKDQLLGVQQTSQNVGFSLWKQPTYDEKLEKLGTTIPHLMKKVEANQDYLECANESLRSDLERWQQEKQKCIKKTLLDFVNKQIEFYEKSVTAWEHAIKELGSQNLIVNNPKK